MNSILLPLVMLIPLAAPAETETKKPDYAKQLKQVEAKVKKDRKNPMLYYRKAQYQCGLGKYDEGYKTAQVAMKRFIRAKENLAWMLLESIPVGDLRVDVHFNMGPKERARNKDGIVRPLSLRIWKADGKTMIDQVDYELGYMNGKPMTAAFGKAMGNRGHALLEISKPGLKYSEIRKAAIKLIKKRYGKKKE